MTNQTLIVDIKRNALDDGPGIRTLIFFKGCPLTCVWCQNPEARSPSLELSFDKQMCSECGSCIASCTQDAIDFEYKFRIIRNKCNLCGICVDNCPNSALKLVGKSYSIGELMEIILKDKVFYDNSKGGVTLSGGEPLYHIYYIHNSLKELRKANIHSCIETAGFYNLEKFEEYIKPHVDLIYFDLKIFNPQLHAYYCKVSNERILENFESLIKQDKIEILPRIPLIPSITDTKENLSALARYLSSLNIKKVGLLPYNPLWLSKSEKIGIEHRYNHSEWLSKEKKEEIKDIFSDFTFKDF